jgi:hypothetical protein
VHIRVVGHEAMGRLEMDDRLPDPLLLREA